MRYFRTASRTRVGVTLLLTLLLILVVGPNRLTQLLSRVVPGFYEGIPCAWLHPASDRANHQSLIGRSSPNPIAVSVVPGSLPTDPAGMLLIHIIVINRTLGTVPIIYDPNRVLVGDNGSSGIGVIFEPPNTLVAAPQRTDPPAVDESMIRLLGPQQRCVHTLEFPAGNVLIDPAINSGTAQVRAYYRNNLNSPIVSVPGAVATPIYGDYGLWVGYVESEPKIVPRSAQQ